MTIICSNWSKQFVKLRIHEDLKKKTISKFVDVLQIQNGKITIERQNDLIKQFLKGSGPILQNQAISAKYLKNALLKAFNQP